MLTVWQAWLTHWSLICNSWSKSPFCVKRCFGSPAFAGTLVVSDQEGSSRDASGFWQALKLQIRSDQLQSGCFSCSSKASWGCISCWNHWCPPGYITTHFRGEAESAFAFFRMLSVKEERTFCCTESIKPWQDVLIYQNKRKRMKSKGSR